LTLAGTRDVLLVAAGVSRVATVEAVVAPPGAAAGPGPPGDRPRPWPAACHQRAGCG
jgi:hypothetical protein